MEYISRSDIRLLRRYARSDEHPMPKAEKALCALLLRNMSADQYHAIRDVCCKPARDLLEGGNKFGQTAWMAARIKHEPRKINGPKGRLP